MFPYNSSEYRPIINHFWPKRWGRVKSRCNRCKPASCAAGRECELVSEKERQNSYLVPLITPIYIPKKHIKTHHLKSGGKRPRMRSVGIINYHRK